jgi:hypothetical protein
VKLRYAWPHREADPWGPPHTITKDVIRGLAIGTRTTNEQDDMLRQEYDYARPYGLHQEH